MKESEISSAEDLDTALAANAMRKQEQLWKAAEGKSFIWGDVVGVLLGAALAVVGFRQLQLEADGILFLLLGLSLISSAVFRRQQAQIDALRELLREVRTVSR